MKPSGSGNNTNYNNNSTGNAYIPELFKTKYDKKREQQAKQNEHIAELRGLDKVNQEKKETQFKSYTKPSKSPGENWRDRDLDEILINSTMANDTSIPLKRRIEYYEEAFKAASSYNTKSRAAYPNADKSKAPVFYSHVLYKNYGVALAQDGQYKKALLHLDKSYLSDRTPFIWMSVSHLMEDDYNKALEGFEQINESDPDYTMATSYCHYLKKDYVKAIQVIERGATRLDSMKSSRDKSYFKHLISALHYFNGNTNEAMQTYNALATKKITTPSDLPNVLPDYFSAPLARINSASLTMLYLLDVQKKLQPDNLYFINSSLNANAIMHRSKAMNADQDALDRLTGNVTKITNTTTAKAPTEESKSNRVDMTNDLSQAIYDIMTDTKGKHMLVSTYDGYSRLYNTSTGKIDEIINDSLPERLTLYKNNNIYIRDYTIDGIEQNQKRIGSTNEYNVVYTKHNKKHIDFNLKTDNPYGFNFHYNLALDYPILYIRHSPTADSGYLYKIKPLEGQEKSSTELIAAVSLKPSMKYFFYSSGSGRYLYDHSAETSCIVDVQQKKVLWDKALASFGSFINRFKGMVFSADEKQCAISTQSGARILDVATGNTLYEIPTPQDLLAKGRHYIAPCADMQSFLFVLEPDQAARGRKDAIWLVRKGSPTIQLEW
jgi:tetratricopeptide (TPR) repeat protein